MKILESKFYVDRRYLMADNDDNNRVVVDNRFWATRYQPYSDLLDHLLGGVYIAGADLVIAQDKLDDLVKCTDFTNLDFSKKTNEFFEKELCYFHPELEIFVVLNTNLSNDYENELFESGLLKLENLYFDKGRDGVKANVETFYKAFVEKYQPDEAKVSILIKTREGFELKTHKITPYPIDLDLMYNDDFAAVHRHIEKSLSTSSKGIVLLHGIAGSGKSNYIKWLTSQVADKKFIFVPSTMIHMLADPSFITLLIDNKNSVLVLEDCENYIGERTPENRNTDMVASILNIADGMLSDVLECQLICTFNSDLSEIDPALLRKGRLIAEYKFRELETAKANAYLAAYGNNEAADEFNDNKEVSQIEEAETTVDAPISLAELVNLGDKSYREHSKKTAKIGFIR